MHSFGLLLGLAALSAAGQVQPSVNIYWGQGGEHPGDRLASYCQQGGFEYITLAFVNRSPENGNGTGYPGTNFAGFCASQVYTNNGRSSYLLSACSFIKEDIKVCQGLGKKVLLSIGGVYNAGSSNYTVSTERKGREFGEFLWKAFGPYDPKWTGPRPFDISAKEHTSVDGFDFDIETKYADQNPWVSLINTIQAFSHVTKSPTIITGAPQCPLADEWFQMKYMIANARFDKLFVQFYNNPDCDARGPGFNFDAWDAFLNTTSSWNAQVYVGLPATPEISGFLPFTDAESLIDKYKGRSRFGGLMFWDAAFGRRNADTQGTPYYKQLHDYMVGGSAANSTTASMATARTSSTTSTTAPMTTTGVSSRTSSVPSSGISSAVATNTSQASTSRSTGSLSYSTLVTNSTATSAIRSSVASSTATSTISPTGGFTAASLTLPTGGFTAASLSETCSSFSSPSTPRSSSLSTGRSSISTGTANPTSPSSNLLPLSSPTPVTSSPSSRSSPIPISSSSDFTSASNSNSTATSSPTKQYGSTVYATSTQTVTSCPPGQSLCPGRVVPLPTFTSPRTASMISPTSPKSSNSNIVHGTPSLPTPKPSSQHATVPNYPSQPIIDPSPSSQPTTSSSSTTPLPQPQSPTPQPPTPNRPGTSSNPTAPTAAPTNANTYAALPATLSVPVIPTVNTVSLSPTIRLGLVTGGCPGCSSVPPTSVPTKPLTFKGGAGVCSPDVFLFSVVMSIVGAVVFTI